MCDMYLLYREDIGVYKTIHKEDKDNFYKIANSSIFQTENKFKLITQKENIKKVLEDNFSSKSRTEEYQSGLPSATVISSALFPYNLDIDSRSNQVSLLKWFNDKSKEEYEAQQLENKLSTDSGTFLHKILELAFTDNVRIFKRVNKLNDYIEEAIECKDIIKMINDFDNRKDYFRDMAKSSLDRYFKEEVKYIDPIFNEIFLNVGYIQGAIDLVYYKNGSMHIGDFKSSKKSKSRDQLISNGYLRQLYIYSVMLLDAGIITKKEYDSLNFEIFFYQWNSGRSKTEYFTKQEVDDNKLYVEYILKWYQEMKK